MPHRITIGHMADGTPLTTEVLSMREYFDARDPHATPAQIHEPNIEDMSTLALEERYAVIVEWLEAGPRPGQAAMDPRCGCSADNEGGSCYWDSPDQIDAELGRRGA